MRVYHSKGFEIMPTSIYYHFQQHFNVSASKAFEWCTTYTPEDHVLMGEKEARREIENITDRTIILTDTFNPGAENQIEKNIKNSEISAIYIHPDAVGNGVGTKLLYRLEEIARSNKVVKIAVHSTLNAKGFYQRHGYLTHGLTFHLLSNGSKLECVRMVKDLKTDTEKRH